jgi:hypothetical protein
MGENITFIHQTAVWLDIARSGHSAKQKISVSLEIELHHTGFIPWNVPDYLL